MNYRERVIRTIQFQAVDQLPIRHAYGLMPGVLGDWHKEGLPHSVKTERDIYEYFGFPVRPKALPVNVGFDPPFENRIIEENDEYQIAVDFMGRTTKVIKKYASLPIAMDFPVKDAETWKDYKRRLMYYPERIGSDLEKIASENYKAGNLNGFGTMGFYWFPRDLMGDENLCIAYYEQPDLVTAILETWCTLVEQVLGSMLERIKIDFIHFGEDMAYRNTSMVSKEIFNKFLKPYYDRINRIIKRYNIPYFSFDSDGCLKEISHWVSDCDVNFIGPNEVQAGNDITEYRKIFGKKMAYDGGLDKRELVKGREAIDVMLEKTIPFMKETGGGWIICLDHRVIEGTKLADFEYYVKRAGELAIF